MISGWVMSLRLRHTVLKRDLNFGSLDLDLVAQPTVNPALENTTSLASRNVQSHAHTPPQTHRHIIKSNNKSIRVRSSRIFKFELHPLSSIVCWFLPNFVSLSYYLIISYIYAWIIIIYTPYFFPPNLSHLSQHTALLHSCPLDSFVQPTESK